MPVTRKQRKAATAGDKPAAPEAPFLPPPGAVEITLNFDDEFYNNIRNIPPSRLGRAHPDHPDFDPNAPAFASSTDPPKYYSPSNIADFRSWIATYKTKSVAQAVHDLRTVVLHVQRFQAARAEEKNEASGAGDFAQNLLQGKICPSLLLPSMMAQYLEDGKPENADICVKQMEKLFGQYERKFRELGME
ncbi:hypothetical protein BLS_007351 [Venturia inaequalis]|uniref:Uncharacterized protein n=1 Tax=Venturia inaequalis TaxID=5025 RepID=A0A8H3UA46_VENIN|nr:hypothetical protein BLS_007351 [Venturia inaequalis]RDI78069.1 hypothetical protein Vi05172_g11984 [Venturia inaequalis]